MRLLLYLRFGFVIGCFALTAWICGLCCLVVVVCFDLFAIGVGLVCVVVGMFALWFYGFGV